MAASAQLMTACASMCWLGFPACTAYRYALQDPFTLARGPGIWSGTCCRTPGIALLVLLQSSRGARIDPHLVAAHLPPLTF